MAKETKIHRGVTGKFRKYFVPHKHNAYHPHLFRNTTITIIFVICTFLLGVSYGNSVFLTKTVLGANIATNVLVDLANQSRLQNHVLPLVRNKKLDYAASLKAADMIDNKYFAHFSPDGTTPWYFINKSGYNFAYAGENLAINFTESNDVENAWMNSPTHRDNLLNTNYRDLGIATKEGMYNGANTIYIVQMFGSEAPGKIQDVFSDYKKDTEAKQNVVEDTRVAEKNPENKIPPTPLKGGATPNIKVIVESKNFISVKNLDATTSEEGKVAGVETYSSWYDRFIFNSSFYIQVFFIILISIISFGIILRTFIEYRRQHYRHLVISLLFLLSILVLAALNLNYLNIF